MGWFKPRIAVTVKSDAEIVAEIHENFNTYGERLLREAQALLAKEVNTEKGERLRKLGFISTKEAVEDKTVKAEKDKQREISELVTYYTNKYPLYRFITEDGVEDICNKYNLVMGDVSKYIGTVPDKNLEEIENFKTPAEEDCRYIMRVSSGRGSKQSYIPYLQYLYESHREKEDRGYYYRYSVEESFKICAPAKDFDLKNMKVEGHKLVRHTPDPVVLFPVYKGYLIVSAWGPEASDSQVVNSKLN